MTYLTIEDMNSIEKIKGIINILGSIRETIEKGEINEIIASFTNVISIIENHYDANSEFYKEFTHLKNQFVTRKHISLNEISLLTGSYILPEYYKVGEQLKNGKICNKNDILLKSPNLRLTASLEKLRLNNNHFQNGSVGKYKNSNFKEYYWDEAEYNDTHCTINPYDGVAYNLEWIEGVFGMGLEDDIPWGNID